MWDGKVGIWPFARREAAKRNSVNRTAGTLEWKPISVDREVYRAMLIDNVLPAIQEKWPVAIKQQLIRIQQDNAPVHIKTDDPIFQAAVEATGLTIELYNQPPNSPDTNINDLAFFASIQSLQHKILGGVTKDSLVDAVYQAYELYPWKKLRNAFLTLQCCFNSIIECNGGNDYKIVHMSKDRLEREGMLPTNIIVTNEIQHWISNRDDDIDNSDESGDDDNDGGDGDGDNNNND